MKPESNEDHREVEAEDRTRDNTSSEQTSLPFAGHGLERVRDSSC